MDERQRRTLTRVLATAPRIIIGLLILALVCLALWACVAVQVRGPITNSEIQVTVDATAEREAGADRKAKRCSLAERLRGECDKPEPAPEPK